MKRKMKRSTKQYIIVALICIIVMGGAAAFTTVIATGQIKEKYEKLLKNANKEMADNKKTVYVAASNINKGDYISTENVQIQTVFSTQPSDTYMSKEDIGKVALVEIMPGTHVLKGMLTENTVEAELREAEYTVININSNIKSGDTIDVCIFFPNGETYIVLSKKVIKGYTPETASCFLWMNEEEILRMSAAIVDASIYAGARLYVTKYIEPNIQEASVVNYTPSFDTLKLLESDPNILERASQDLSRQVRKELEERLAASFDSDTGAINWQATPNVPSANNETTSETQSSEDINDDAYDTSEETSTDSSPILGDSDNNVQYNNDESELGSNNTEDDYFYYAEENLSEDGEIEYGE